MNFLFDNNMPARLAAALFVKTGGARQMNAWQIAQLGIKAWDGMEQHAAQHRRPLIALVQPNGRVLRD